MKKPNFIFILIDDMGWKDIACNGSEFYETPNVDGIYPYTYLPRFDSFDRAFQVQLTVLDSRTIYLRGPRAGVDVIRQMVNEIDATQPD